MVRGLHHRWLRLWAAAALLTFAAGAPAASAELDAEVRRAVQDLYETVPGAEALAREAAGMLVFPGVFAGGVVVGGEYGEGALLVGGAVVDYYNTASASLGITLGAQVKTQILMFMSAKALTRFRDSRNWEIGVDEDVVLAAPGRSGALDDEARDEPVVAFVFTHGGLMYNLSLEGSKITRLSYGD